MTSRTVSPARELAVGILRDVLEKGERASAAVSRRLGRLSPEDAGLLREIVLGVLRWKSALDDELARVCRLPLSRLAPNLREILEVALYQIRHLDRVPDYAVVDEAVRDAQGRAGVRAGKLVNALLRNLLRAPVRHPSDEAPDEDRVDPISLARDFSHPEFLVARWIERFGPQQTLALLRSDNTPSGLDLMANPRKTDRESLAAALSAEGIQAEGSPVSPLALVVRSGHPLHSPLLAAGHFAVQDLGSQALARLLPPGDTLVDLAAAPGGKSFAAVALSVARQTLALDRSQERLLMVQENRERLGIPEVFPVCADVNAVPLPPGRFERVLFDSPCSGTGTLRKNPEIRYRVTPEAIARLAGSQRAGLRSAAALLAPGGYLLYSTCSLEREENEAVVDDVLSADPTLELAPIVAADGLAPFVAGARFQMLPSRDNDGFTAHLLKRGRCPSPRPSPAGRG